MGGECNEIKKPFLLLNFEQIHMKKIILVSVFLSSIIYSQENYFPLEIGNYWQFKVTHYSTPQDSQVIGYDYMQVLCDTLLENHLQPVKKVKSIPIAPWYSDSLQYLQYDSRTNSIIEYSVWADSGAVLFNFNALPYDSWYSLHTQMSYYGFDTINIFNSALLVKPFFGGLIPSFVYQLAENFGPVKIVNDQSYVITSVFNFDLVYAKINGIEYGQLVSVKDKELKSLAEFTLSQNYPNPFNPSTKIKYSIPKTSFVALNVFDILGREVATIVNEEKTIGNYEVEFDGKNLPSGVYFYKFKVGDFIEIRKMVLLR